MDLPPCLAPFVVVGEEGVDEPTILLMPDRLSPDQRNGEAGALRQEKDLLKRLMENNERSLQYPIWSARRMEIYRRLAELETQ